MQDFCDVDHAISPSIPVLAVGWPHARSLCGHCALRLSSNNALQGWAVAAIVAGVRRRCSLLPRPASRNNFSEQGEGERARAREVATTAKRSGGERARRWLMDELGALGVDSGEEKWGRRGVGVGEPSLRQLCLRAVGRQAAGAVERQSELRAGRAPHPSPSSARLALPPLLLLSTNSSSERPQRDDLGAAWARAVVETQAEQRWEHAKGWGGEGGFGGPWHGSAAVPTMVAAVAWWAAVWSAVTASVW
ncbi:unnamed protein product [Closterium sp. NIES-64]|nr:unnamed protein product [Closterium sp. NIES-64]